MGQMLGVLAIGFDDLEHLVPILLLLAFAQVQPRQVELCVRSEQPGSCQWLEDLDRLASPAGLEGENARLELLGSDVFRVGVEIVFHQAQRLGLVGAAARGQEHPDASLKGECLVGFRGAGQLIETIELGLGLLGTPLIEVERGGEPERGGISRLVRVVQGFLNQGLRPFRVAHQHRALREDQVGPIRGQRPCAASMAPFACSTCFIWTRYRT